MSYNGSGTFQINTSGQPVVTGTSISSTVFNALTADLATGLSTAITKDGQTTTTARIPFALGINSTLVTNATNTTSGSIITAGGVGIAKALYVGTTANVAGAITPSQTAGIVGTTTNNNADAGSIGEVISSSVAVGSAVSLTTATTATSGKTVTSISLTAGDWDVFGSVGINMAAGTNFTVIAGGINTVNNELNALYEEQILFNYGAAGTVPLNTQTFALFTTRVSIASTTTYYLIAYAQFTVNTATGYGRITARRAR